MPPGGLHYRKRGYIRPVVVGLLILAALAVVATAVYSFATGV